MDRLRAPELPSWLSALVPFQRYCVQLGTHAMHVMEVGAGYPVLMLHGNPTWGFLWRKVAAELENHAAPVRLIMPDLIGLGFSDKPDDARWHTLDRHAEHVGALIDALDLDEAVFVGQDWGGPIGGLAFARRPGRMRGAVILNTVLGPPRPTSRPALFHRFARLPVVSELVFRGLGFPQNHLSIAQGDKRSIRGEVARAYRWPLRGLENNVAPLALARMVPDASDHPSVPALSECRDFMAGFTGPAEIVWGDRDPVLGRAFKRVQEVLPHARVTRTAAGHFLQEEVPAEIAAAITRVVADCTR